MLKYIPIIFTLIITSFYLFPFEFTFLLGMNTKMIIAGVGIIVLALQLAQKKTPSIDNKMFILFILAAVVSLIGFITVTYNNTFDYTYTTYIVSMVVWLSAAYVATTCMRITHGNISVILVSNYIIAICVLQCISAIMIDALPSFKYFVNSFVSGFGFEAGVKELDGARLYGIGAVLDVAGTRFSAALILIAYITGKYAEELTRKQLFLYLIAFLIILIIGNMIGRTTTIGGVIAIAYWIYSSRIYHFRFENRKTRILKYILGLLLISLPIICILYNTNYQIRNNIEFAFEGFFSLAEKGKWEVSSNEILKKMYRYPETFKTWFIGDGYIENPKNDPYFIGKIWGGYYMGTDVGYLRFIYYFGLIGLSAFIIFMLQVGQTCIKRAHTQKGVFLLLLLLNFTIWFKVSTDIFLIFGLFLMVGEEENECSLKDLLKNREETLQ